ncbi:50S ribosomal protein L23 [Candidatus Parcubacteria bacterium]|nr:50S ribosomal protein L23 [Candidatus Parcubacteria bacterium]
MADVKIEKKSALKSPRITEKAALAAESKGMYAFNITPEATKKSVAASIKEKYKVTPLRVHLLAVPDKQVFRGKRGVRRGGRKAYVYLKKGDKIEFA